MGEGKDEAEMSLVGHLDEFRNRIIICVLFFIIASIGSYFLTPSILKVIVQYIPKKELIFLAPFDAFLVYIKLSLLLGLIISSPVILYQIWRFAAPALYKQEKKFALLLIFFSIILFLLGSVLGFYTVPFALRILLGFGGEELVPMLSADRFISFFINTILLFGLAFEFPIVVIFLVKIGIISEEILKRNRKYSLLLIIILSAIITPSADPFTLMILTLPLVLLYELSIFIAKIVKR